MRPLHKREPRATLAKAQEARARGGYQVGNYIPDNDRLTIFKEFEDELKLIIKKNFPRTSNLEYAILKTHLIIEHCLTNYIRCTSYQLVELEDIRFTFSQKLDIAFLHGFGSGDAFTVPSIELLNKLRNQVAHRFILDKNIINELLRLNFSTNNAEQISKLTDRQRIACLRRWCIAICSHTVGWLHVAILLTSKP